MYDDNKEKKDYGFEKTKYKSDNATQDNMFKKTRKPDNIIELLTALKEYREIEEKGSEISDPLEKKLYRLENSEHLSELYDFVSAGLKLNDNSLQENIIQSMVSFVSENGMDGSKVIERLSEVQLFLSDVYFTSNTCAYRCSNNIFLDYRKVNFDSDGCFIGFKEEEENFVSHVLTHEFFHALSSENDEDNLSFLGDAYSEGFTEMLTEMITNKKYTESYGFLVSVCSLFRDIMGMEKVLDDYVNHLGVLPNLSKLFLECGVNEEEFKNFHIDLNNILELTLQKKPDNSEFIASEQERCVDFLRKRIVEPYCQIHPEREEEIRVSFNGIFHNPDERERERIR